MKSIDEGNQDFCNIKYANIEELNNIIRNIPMNKIVFWVGAGIDCEKPTGLPNGNGLTSFILNCACGNKNAKNLERVWAEKSRKISIIMENEDFIPKIPRLETIIEAVREYEHNQNKKISVINGFKSFSSKVIYYNIDHYCLAKCLHMGADIVTVNYGDFVPKAYSDIYGENAIEFDKSKNMYYTKPMSGHMYYIHGVSENLDTLGASLSNVKGRFPDFFVEKVKEWMEERYFIFLGYGGVDTLDVNPMFNNMGLKYNARAIYIRHSSNNIFNNSIEIYKNEKTLLKYFYEKILCACNTKEFLKMLLDDNKEDYEGYKEVNDKYYDWKLLFLRFADEWTASMQFACLLNICYRLSIPINEVYGRTWIYRIKDIDNVDTWYRNYIPYRNAVIIQNKILMKQMEVTLKKNCRNDLMESDIHASHNRISETVKAVNIVNEVQCVRDMLLKGQVIQWDKSTNINRFVQNLLFSRLKLMLLNKKTKDEYKELPLVKKCLDEIIEAGYDAVFDVNQINTAYKTRGACYVLLNHEIAEATKDFDTAILNYADISSIGGIASTLIYKSISYLIYYKASPCKEYFEKAKQSIRFAQKIVYIGKLNRYKRHIKILWMMLFELKLTTWRKNDV